MRLERGVCGERDEGVQVGERVSWDRVGNIDIGIYAHGLSC